jgi:hypothetical protein
MSEMPSTNRFVPRELLSTSVLNPNRDVVEFRLRSKASWILYRCHRDYPLLVCGSQGVKVAVNQYEFHYKFLVFRGLLPTLDISNPIPCGPAHLGTAAC